MGEYVKIEGKPVKLGTCEDLYYYTRTELERLLPMAEEVPGNLPPLQYLEPSHGWRYRFPFPDEAGTNPQGREYARGVEIIRGETTGDLVDHKPTCSDPSVSVTQQKIVGAETWIVVDCPACDAKARLPFEGAMRVAKKSIEKVRFYVDAKCPKKADFWIAMTERILAGYEGARI